MSQTAKTKTGIKWSVIDQVVRQFITLVISGVLSRLLTPAEYGLLGMVTVAIGFLQVFKDMGLGSSIIQKQGITAEEQSTIFWLNVAIGVALTLLLLLTAPWIAGFFNEPQLTPLIRVMSLNFVIGSMAIVPDALIRKAIDFKSYFYRNLGTVIAGGFLGIWLAYKGFGVWALVGQSLLTTLAGLIISLRMVQWRPQWVFRKNLLKSHLRYSIPLLGDSSINYWVRNVDNLLVGKVLGAVSLGIYTRAYNLMLLPVRQISGTLTRVMFPSFALIQQDTPRIWEQYQKMAATVATISFPLMAFLGIYAREVILIVYGYKWLEVVPIFQVLCLLGALQSIGTLSGSVFYAKGRTLLMFKVGLFSKTTMITGIVVGLWLGGLMGMVWGYVSVSMFCFLVETFFVAKILNNTLLAFMRGLLPETLAVLFFAIAMLVAKIFYSGTGDMLSLSFVAVHATLFILFILVYKYLLKAMNSKGLQIIMNNLYGKRKKAAAANAGSKVH